MADNTNPKADFDTILTERGQTVTRRRHTNTVGPSGEITAVSTADATLSMIIRRLTDKDRKLLPQGLSRRGQLKGLAAGDADLQDNDIIIDGNSDEFRIIGFFRREWDTGTVAFHKVIMVRSKEG